MFICTKPVMTNNWMENSTSIIQMEHYANKSNMLMAYCMDNRNHIFLVEPGYTSIDILFMAKYMGKSWDIFKMDSWNGNWIISMANNMGNSWGILKVDSWNGIRIMSMTKNMVSIWGIFKMDSWNGNWIMSMANNMGNNWSILKVDSWN